MSIIKIRTKRFVIGIILGVICFAFCTWFATSKA